MQFKSNTKISFMSLGDDTFKDDNGELIAYDFTKVHIKTDLAESENSFGSPYIEYKWGTSDNYREFIKKYGKLDEFAAEVTWENVASPNGKSSKLFVIDIKPIQAQQSTQAKA